MQLSPPSTSRTFSSFHSDILFLLHTHSSPLPSPSPSPTTYSLCLSLTPPGPPVSGVTQDVSFCVWLTSGSTVSSGLSHGGRCQGARPFQG